jgi:hypothetical protein
MVLKNNYRGFELYAGKKKKEKNDLVDRFGSNSDSSLEFADLWDHHRYQTDL